MLSVREGRKLSLWTYKFYVFRTTTGFFGETQQLGKTALHSTTWLARTETRHDFLVLYWTFWGNAQQLGKIARYSSTWLARTETRHDFLVHGTCFDRLTFEPASSAGRGLSASNSVQEKK